MGRVATGVTEIRKRQGLTITDVAVKTGMSRVTVYAVEAGEIVSLETLVTIARVLDVPLAEIAPDAAKELEGVA